MANVDELKLEIMTVRVPEGTLARIDSLLKGGELRSAFIRKAVEAELRRRHKAVAKPVYPARPQAQRTAA